MLGPLVVKPADVAVAAGDDDALWVAGEEGAALVELPTAEEDAGMVELCTAAGEDEAAAGEDAAEDDPPPGCGTTIGTPASEQVFSTTWATAGREGPLSDGWMYGKGRRGRGSDGLTGSIRCGAGRLHTRIDLRHKLGLAAVALEIHKGGTAVASQCGREAGELVFDACQSEA